MTQRCKSGLLVLILQQAENFPARLLRAKRVLLWYPIENRCCQLPDPGSRQRVVKICGDTLLAGYFQIEPTCHRISWNDYDFTRERVSQPGLAQLKAQLFL